MHVKTEKNFACGEDFHKKHRAAVTLISSHESIKAATLISSHESENLNNCSLKKCITKLPPQKYEHKQERILTDKHK